MAYTPKTWTCGDTISAEDLNHMEQGIANSGGGTLVVRLDHVDEEHGRAYLDKTWQEVYTALAQGKVVTLPANYDEDEEAFVSFVVHAQREGGYGVTTSNGSETLGLSADSADGYLYQTIG